jgi:hypothetical protein
MRALTPLPFATGTFDEAPTTARTLPPRPPPIPTQARSTAPVQASAHGRSMPAGQSLPAAPAAPPAFAPSPFQWTVAPSHAPTVEPVAQPASRDPRRAVSRPIYPVRRSRKLLWFALTLFFTTGIAVGAVVAYPPMLDPMCDDYEWFGADAARDLRQRAHDTHAAIADFITTL